ncbi:hypothetical protein SISNIDRAFT_489925 [Sistotremastrum niveocremeum HHB9708]|uniref:Arrestin-like N-terminal domain-containing protein n=1 Tax=Sistotremastrum niveocremeum HHB9708 TaxID=1314777 RepID=A0A164PFS0_9AGAM|nr:hypothetical protein SISNIDRAFT_489925 [Sistotremastrum niveocremeum HHB9708]
MSLCTINDSGVELDFNPELRFPGSLVDGRVSINLATAARKGFTVVTAELIAEVKTRVDEDKLSQPLTFNEQHTLVSSKSVLWTADARTPPESTIITAPFSFLLPDRQLPPSFLYEGSDASASIQYYVKIVANKKAWYKSGLKIYRSFAYLPFGEAVQYPLIHAPRRIVKDHLMLRKGVMFGGMGKVEGEFSLPDVTSLPLFQDIPFSLRIRCFSKPLPESQSSNPSLFTFPLPPSSSDQIDMSLLSLSNLAAQKHWKRVQIKQGSIQGFSKQTKSKCSDHYVVEPLRGNLSWVRIGDSRQGRWCQEVMFNSTLHLKCPPTFDIGLLQTSYHIQIRIPFPGVGNEFSMTVPLARISSGMSKSTHDIAHGMLDLPPSYWEVAESDNQSTVSSEPSESR